jgi:hypothetical protein
VTGRERIAHRPDARAFAIAPGLVSDIEEHRNALVLRPAEAPVEAPEGGPLGDDISLGRQAIGSAQGCGIAAAVRESGVGVTESARE